MDGLREAHAAWKRRAGAQLEIEIEEALPSTTVLFDQADVDALLAARVSLGYAGAHREARRVDDLISRMRGEMRNDGVATRPRLRVVR